MIFKRVITDPHASWFREAYYRFWPEWWNFPEGRDPGPTTSIFDAVLLRVEVWPGSPSRITLGWDNMGRTARIYLDTSVDKLAFCEQVIHELLSLFIAVFLEQYPPMSYLTPEESEARITRCCELFGQPRSAWNSGPLHLHVREAVIQTIKEHCADRALLKTPGSTSSLKLQAMPIMPVGYVHPNPPPLGYETPPPRWITVPGEPNFGFTKPRYSPVGDWWGGFGSRFGYDKLPALGAPVSLLPGDPALKDSLYYDVDPGRAWPIPFGYYGGGGFGFPELIPPEWRELLDLLASPPGITTGNADETWPTDQTYTAYRHGLLSIPVVWEGSFYPVGNGAFLGTGFSGGQAAMPTGDWFLQPDIPWGSNLGYIAEQIYWKLDSITIPGHWYRDEGDSGALALFGDWYWREEYAVTWDYIEISVLDYFGHPLATGGGQPGAPGLPYVVHINGAGMGAFDEARLPVTAVIGRVTVSGIWNYTAPTTNATYPGGRLGGPQMVDPLWPHFHSFGLDEDTPFYPGGGANPGTYDPASDPLGVKLMSDQQLLDREIRSIQQLTGNMGIFAIKAYATPMSQPLLISDTPPWPGTARFPGVIEVGPGLRGAHPTVKGLRGGRVTGRLEPT